MMRKGPIRLVLALCLLPMIVLIGLLFADEGSNGLRIALVGAFLILAVIAGGLALMGSGATKGKIEGEVGVTRVNIEFENPRESDENGG